MSQMRFGYETAQAVQDLGQSMCRRVWHLDQPDGARFADPKIKIVAGTVHWRAARGPVSIAPSGQKLATVHLTLGPDRTHNRGLRGAP